MTSRKIYKFLSLCILLGLVWFFSSTIILPALGRFLIKNNVPKHADAVIVLYTGVDYYPRLIEAADLFRKGITDYIVIDGNRKNDALRELEAMGFKNCCPWYEDTMLILELMGVPREKIIAVSAEDAFDTISEALAVGPYLLKKDLSRVIITTSKFHSRRARHIWQHLYGDSMQIFSAAAQKDEFDPKRWWHDGRQIRWVLSEYGAWIYYFWQTAFSETD